MATYKGYNTIDNNFKSVVTTDTDLIKRDILNHFSIRKGEKLMNGEFGSSLPELVMEPMTPELTDLILEEVNTVFRNEVRVNVNQLIVDEYEHGIRVQAELTYVNTNQTETLLINFNRRDGTVTV